jgi:hypothetical protein
LEPNHTHFLLVQGQHWGDESETLTAAAGSVAGLMPSLTVLLNGGVTSLIDAANSTRASRPVIVLQGSGRAADTIASAVTGQTPATAEVADLVGSGLLRIVDISEGPKAIGALVERTLRGEP